MARATSWGRPSVHPRVILGLILAAFVGLGLGGAHPFGPSGTVAGAEVSIELYGSTLLGWSRTPGAETNPGPTLVVDTGDEVTITLTSEDGLEHGLFIDYDNDGVIDASDFVSATTTDTITFTLTASVSGTFTYYCRVASVPYNPTLSLMRGTWVTNSPPTGSVDSPTGAESWTGGSAHDVVFSVSDAEGDPLEVLVTYSYNGGTAEGTIQGPFSPGPNPNVVSWTPSGFSATDTVVHVQVTDSRGSSRVVDSPPFEVDSAPPTMISASPASGATGVGLNSWIWVTWSERMDADSSGAPGTFAVRVVGGSWLTGSVSWSGDGTQMTFAPTGALAPTTAYEVHVNTTARDDSNPGNGFAGPVTWTFTTSSIPDGTAPTITSIEAVPTGQVEGGFVNLTADVQDDVSIGRVSARILGPSLDGNFTMARASGITWYLYRSYPAHGHYDVTIWATDASGNAASQATGIDISPRPSGPPADLPAPSSVAGAFLEDGAVRISWTPVTSSDLAGYHVYRGDAAGANAARLTDVPILPSTPPEYVDRTIRGGETYTYMLTSVNTTGSESVYSAPFRINIPLFRSAPLFDPVPWAIAGVMIGAFVGALYGLAWRRRPAG